MWSRSCCLTIHDYAQKAKRVKAFTFTLKDLSVSRHRLGPDQRSRFSRRRADLPVRSRKK